MSRYYSYETIKDNAKDVTLENGVKHRCIDPDALLDIEPADARENVKGRWVEVVDRTEMYDKEGVKTWGMLFQCNQCGFVLNAVEGHTGQYNYCPNCGAEMQNGENDE